MTNPDLMKFNDTVEVQTRPYPQRERMSPEQVNINLLVYVHYNDKPIMPEEVSCDYKFSLKEAIRTKVKAFEDM